MTTEREYLGYAPAPAKTWAKALEQANAHFIEAAHHSANGDTTQALAAGAIGVGLAAEARQLEDQAADDRAAEQEAEGIMALGLSESTERNHDLTEDEIEQAMNADPRLSRLDVLNGIGARRPLPPTFEDFFGTSGGAR